MNNDSIMVSCGSVLMRDALPSLVHFFGPDGAGKSTHVDILIDTLREREPRVRKIWLRSPHTFAFLLWRLFVRIGFFRTVTNPFGDSIKLPAVNRKRSLRVFWSLMEFFSVLPLIMRIRFSMSRGYKCIAERFILDTVTTIAYFVDDPGFLRSRISRVLYLFIPRDTVFIFLDSDFGTVFKRRANLRGLDSSQQKTRDYGTLPKSAVEPQSFINFQRMSYKILAKSFNALEIDTSERSIEQTSREILEYLDQ